MILIAILLALASGFLAGIAIFSFVCIDKLSAKLFIVSNLMAWSIGFGCGAYKYASQFLEVLK